MSQLLKDVLLNRNYAEPPEIQQIKAFVEAQVGITPSVAITTESYIIGVRSAGAAGALRGKIFQLQKQLESKKRIVIRIS